MPERLKEIIVSATKKAFDTINYDFSLWYMDNFDTDYYYESKEELQSFSEDDQEYIKSDWIQWILHVFVEQTCKELGIDTDTSKKTTTINQISLIEEISDIVRDELQKQIDQIEL